MHRQLGSGAAVKQPPKQPPRHRSFLSLLWRRRKGQIVFLLICVYLYFSVLGGADQQAREKRLASLHEENARLDTQLEIAGKSVQNVNLSSELLKRAHNAAGQVAEQGNPPPESGQTGTRFLSIAFRHQKPDIATEKAEDPLLPLRGEILHRSPYSNPLPSLQVVRPVPPVAMPPAALFAEQPPEVQKMVARMSVTERLKWERYQQQLIEWLHRTPDVWPMSTDLDSSLRATVVIPIVMFTYKRHEYLARALDKLLSLMERHPGRFELFVSQDSADFPAVTSTIKEFQGRYRGVKHIINTRNVTGVTEREHRRKYDSYYAIAHHYKFALDSIFADSRFTRVIIMEEDMELSSDALDYFYATSWLMDADQSIWCVSAYNDNGKDELVRDPSALYRTDFFPGLGWMTSRTVWEELSAKWPLGFWDDWMRQPWNRRFRHCIRPELSRSMTFGRLGGASSGYMFRDHIATIKLDTEAVDWQKMDLSYLLRPNYDETFNNIIDNARRVNSVEELVSITGTTDAKYYYGNNLEFIQAARRLKLMIDFKDNVPRTSYKGVVTFRQNGIRCHLVSTSRLYA